MDFNKDRTRVELDYNEVKKLPWFGQLVSDLRGTDMKEIEKEKPSFRFFKHGEAEMFVGQSQAESSDGFVSIGAVGVEGREWDSFLQELEEYVLETNLDSSIPPAPEGWSKTDAEDGYKYNHEIKVNAVKLQPVVIAVHYVEGDHFAELYFSEPPAEEFSEKIDGSGNTSHYASERLSFQEAINHAKKFAEKHKTADEIRQEANAPK